MNSVLLQEPPPSHMTRACAFTLATALAWIGHDCMGACPTQTRELPAAVWYVDDPSAGGKASIDTVVIVRFGLTPTPDPAAPHLELLTQVNECVRRDHIRVREREAATWDCALASVAARAELRPPLPAGALR